MYRMQTARLSVYFKEPQFTVSKRSQAYGITNLIAICGGLLSLFLGVSLLSIVEILYFCTLRMWRSLRVRQQTAHVLAAYQTDWPEPIFVEPTKQEPDPVYPDLNQLQHASIQFE